MYMIFWLGFYLVQIGNSSEIQELFINREYTAVIFEDKLYTIIVIKT